MLRVRLLGGLALEAGGRPLDVPASRPARELLAWLALHPGTHPRLELAMRFWPDVLESSARASLRTTLHELRRALGDAETHLDVDRERVGLTDVWVDVHELDGEALLAGGEPLAGIDRDWAVEARDEHRERVASELARLAEESDEPLRWAREAVRHDPLSEDAARRLMRLLAAAGDRAAAMSAYVRLEDRLERELSVASLARRRAGCWPRSARVRRRRSGPRCAPRSRRRSRPAAARSPAATPNCDGCSTRPRGGAVLLAGEPGIGKTRLLAEAGRRAHERGATVRYGRCYEEQVAPYEPFQEALGAEVFGRLVDAAGDERWRLFEAVGEHLEGALLLLDDLHWGDAGSLRLLAHLLRRPRAAGRARRLPRQRDLTHAPAGGHARRPAPRRARRARPRQRAAGARGGRARRGEPRPGGPGGSAAPRDRRQPVLHRGGPAPSGRRAAAGERRAPDPGGRQGRHRPPPLPARAGDGARADRRGGRGPRVRPRAAGGGARRGRRARALEEAASAQMVREEPGRAGRYTFAHALVRETLYDELSLTRRVRTHRALADALQAMPGHRLAELAHHRLEAAAASGGAPAADAALAAAREAMAALAYEDAAALCERALAALEPGEDARRAELLLALGEARLRSGAPAREAFAAAAARSPGRAARRNCSRARRSGSAGSA